MSKINHAPPDVKMFEETRCPACNFLVSNGYVLKGKVTKGGIGNTLYVKCHCTNWVRVPLLQHDIKSL